MISERTRGLNNILFICRAAAVLLAFGIAMLVVSLATGSNYLHLQRYPLYAFILLLGLTVEAAIRSNGTAPEDPLQRSLADQFRLTIRQTAFAAGALLLYLTATKDAFISRTFLASLLPILYLVLFWSNRTVPRLVARRFFGRRRERAILIGSPAKAQKMRRWLRNKAPFGYEVLGVVTDQPDALDSPGLPILGKLSDLEQLVSDRQVTEAILLGLPEDQAAHERLVDVLEEHAVRIMILSNLEEKLRHAVVHLEDDGHSFVTTREEPLQNPLNRSLKRLLDVVVALPTVLIILPPITLMVWLLQRFQSPGPIFFRQIRAGLQNSEFRILKFRTMHVSNPDEARQATHNDSRIFPAGSWLRRLSIDELPQFWNVLRGEMSVVGPRPHLPVHNQMFARQMRKYHIRALVKPGVSGLAQLRGFRGEVHGAEDIKSRLESDISYLENWSLSLDVLVIFRTFLQIVFLFVNSLLFKAVGPKRSEPDMPLAYRRGERLGGREDTEYEPLSLRRSYRQILGIRFFTGSASEAVSLGMQGGLVVAPSAPVLIGLADHPVHRAAVVSSDLAITDSGLMVLLWGMITGEKITRVSGLEFLDVLLDQPALQQPGATFWVMPNELAMQRNLAHLRSRGFAVSEDDCYIAPNYGGERNEITDQVQLELIRKKRPAHIIIAIGGGVQERLGAELRRNLDYRPSIYCLGAAIGFLSGDQVNIPMWADRCRLGWLFRCFSDPGKFLPRYWEARKLLSLMLEHQGRLPVNPAPRSEPPVDSQPAPAIRP